ncbi:alpha/beta fold hydrolase [Actinokineospora sp.]|uniref:alpha/beta fold hydrolase n=1 Tax=Actinokineospora sp. TaxID=1872133 RepID=UPI003D6A9E87
MARIGHFTSEAARDAYFTAYTAAMAECPEPLKTLDIETRHGTTRVYRHGVGDGPPIVLLSAMASTSAGWADHIRGLAQRHPVYAIDALGEPGGSVQTAPIRSPAERALWLDDVLAGLDLSGVHLVGASSGGHLAVSQAIHRPDRIASVSLLDPTLVTAGFSPAVLALAVPVVAVNREWLWRRFLNWLVGPALADGPAMRVVLAGILSYKNKLPPQFRLPADDLRTVTLPVLAVFAGSSVAHNARKAAERARALWPHAEVDLWADSGHHLGPGIERHVLDFIGRH